MDAWNRAWKASALASSREHPRKRTKCSPEGSSRTALPAQDGARPSTTVSTPALFIHEKAQVPVSTCIASLSAQSLRLGCVLSDSVWGGGGTGSQGPNCIPHTHRLKSRPPRPSGDKAFKTVIKAKWNHKGGALIPWDWCPKRRH